MDKIFRRTVVITIIETWTIIWADGTERTVVYHSGQRSQALPNDPTDPQAGNDLEAIATAANQGAPIAQAGASDALGGATD